MFVWQLAHYFHTPDSMYLCTMYMYVCMHMYVCMYVRMYIYVLCTCMLYAHACMVCIHVYIYTCTHVCSSVVPILV